MTLIVKAYRLIDERSLEYAGFPVGQVSSHS